MGFETHSKLYAQECIRIDTKRKSFRRLEYSAVIWPTEHWIETKESSTMMSQDKNSTVCATFWYLVQLLDLNSIHDQACFEEF